MRSRFWQAPRWQKLGLCLAIGALGLVMSAVPAVLELEQNAGLDWMFRLRGPIESPPEVALISIDTESATALGLHPDPDRWPRSLHARLIERLNSAGAAVIAFDIIFDSPRDEADDREFAAAVREAGNVILLERLRTRTLADSPVQGAIAIEERIPPIPALREAAIATAPFPLPLVPNKVSQFWAFGPADPTVLTLPAITFHAYSLDVHDDFLALLEAVKPGTHEAIQARHGRAGTVSLSAVGSEIRNLLRGDPGIATEMLSRLPSAFSGEQSEARQAAPRSKLESLTRLYGGPDSRFLNFYGPARSIETVPYHRIISDDWNPAESGLAGKAIFVGYSEQNATEQQDTFYTAFSARSGVSLSGAEIGANAFANLLDDSSIEPLSMQAYLTLVFTWGAAITALLALLPVSVAVVSVLVAASGYVLLASYLFAAAQLWLPIVVPVIGLVPLSLLTMFGWRYAHARVQSERARRTLQNYLPPWVVDQVSRESVSSRPQPQLLHGTCLVTDAEDFTSLSERVSPEKLHGLLNEYLAVLSPEIEQRGGFVADISGDSLVAMWASTERDATAPGNACRAAQEILRAVGRFNQGHPGLELPTRIGIHSGQVLLGDVGAESHFEYRAVGDMVNTASRIQGLNKQLRTDFLVSRDVLEGADYTFARNLGRFILAGKTVPLELWDMVDFDGPLDAGRRELADLFESAMECFRSGRWPAATEAFENVLARFPSDGPSTFYLDLSRKYQAEGPGPSWPGVVAIAKK